MNLFSRYATKKIFLEKASLGALHQIEAWHLLIT